MRKIWTVVLVLVIACGLIFAVIRANPRFGAGSSAAPVASSTSTVLQVVAAENFWGSLVSQLGGSHVQVLSVVSDPNADPHEYESNATDARTVATANYVIENGAGYDSWMDKLVDAGSGGSPDRKVLNVADLLGKKEGDNPHFWYDPVYVNQAIARMEQDLIALDPADTAYYQAQYTMLQASLAPYQSRILSCDNNLVVRRSLQQKIFLIILRVVRRSILFLRRLLRKLWLKAMIRRRRVSSNLKIN